MDEEAYKKELADAGVDIPEVKEEPKEEIPEEPAEEKEETPEPDAETEPLKEEPKEQRKRSIYDDLKDKKKEVKTERELREQVERERDELAAKLAAVGNATTGKDTADAEEDAIAYAAKVGADPDLVKRIIADARKGFESKTDESLKKDLDEFKAWKTQNSSVIEKQLFEEEFAKVTPTLKELFPTASPEEMNVVKKELDSLSHREGWNDKSLDYVAFKHKDTLSALISPKKRGMEGKGRKDVVEESFDFNPNADYSKMSLKERAAWEESYRNIGKSEGLTTDASGKKLFI